ncbi:MAG: Unknown protein [uncultured Sulfurovum sp.]|uniref:T6SS Phospholipase effector Tle1-like catalytic domain-containing protein n=1 Tax=uncultured Sulfurovum sp. TaxID=269237 RepID=A0A6S6S9P2_9BACT|nr:MAG: Unknown protein [uncultured Sulfurovum sp.]
MKRIIKYLSLILVLGALIGCSAKKPILHLPISKTNEAQKLVIFIDGTDNDESSYTNVSKLRNLITLQNRTDIRSAYVEGVGNGYLVLGKIFGTGFGKDIRQAYEFLTTHYKTSDNKIYLFGFSRGSFAVRRLAGLVQVAGIPDLSTLTKEDREKLVEKVYDIYMDYDGKSSDNKITIMKNQRKRIATQLGKYYSNHRVQIEFVGIWDTVEALAIPDYEENVTIIDEPPMIDQLCNAKEVAHVLSLDDDRARIFTPILLDNNASIHQCGTEIIKDRDIQQVFFSGAHSDVGGGYADTDIDGVSLNWMLSKIDKSGGSGLVPENTRVYADPLGKTHDPEADLAFGYRFMHRSISRYKKKYLLDNFTVHQSVIDRLAVIPRQCNEIQWKDESLTSSLSDCFEFNKANNTFHYNKNRGNCDISVTHEEGYISPVVKEMGDVPLCTIENVFPCKIQIDANISKRKTGVKLSKDNSYTFKIKLLKNWNDHEICSTPEDGRRFTRYGSKVSHIGMALISPFEEITIAGYTELIGSIGHDKIRLGQLVKNHTIFSPTVSGELIVSINEPTILGKRVYNNNNGQLELIITQID